MIEVKVQQNALAGALAVVTKASKPKGILAACKLIHVELASNRLSLTCFNGEFVANGRIAALGLDTGSAYLDAATLRDVVQTMDGEITLKIDKGEVRLECGVNKAAFKTSDETLPAVDTIDSDESVTLSGADFQRVGSVAVFASNDEARASLHGVHCALSLDGDGKTSLQAQAADGLCLGRIGVLVEPSPELSVKLAAGLPKVKDVSALLPVEFMRMLVSVVEDDDQVEFHLCEGNRAAFRVTGEGRDFTFESALLAESFPVSSVEDILAKAVASKGLNIAIQISELEKVIRQVAAIGTRHMFIKVAGEVIRIASGESEYGQAKNVLPGTAAGGEAQVWLNTDLLLKITKTGKGGLIVKIAGALDPVLVKFDELTALIMPMQGQGDPFENEEPALIDLEQVVPLSA